jgi:lysophospholipase L1-like esterase
MDGSMRAAVAGLIVLTLCVAGCSNSNPNTPTPTPTPTPPTPPTGNPDPPAGPTTPPAVPRVAKLRYLAFGDSLTEGVVSAPYTQTLVTTPHAYPARLAEVLRGRYRDQPEIAVFNEGKAGEFSTDGKTRLPDAIKAHAPEVLLLLEGANDINFLGRRGITRVVIALEDMIKDASRRGLVVFVGTLPRQREGGRNAGGAEFVEELNVQIRKTALEEGATVVDVYNQLDLSLVGEDGLHLTEAGYVRLAEIFAAAIRQAFETQPAFRAPPP